MNKQFEIKVYGMGLQKGMFAHNGQKYISPITQKLYELYLKNELNARVVHEIIGDLK